MTCSVIGCEKPAATRGWCQAHYSRVLRTGDPGPAIVAVKNPGQPCTVEGCRNTARQRGWCGTHYTRWRRTGATGTGDIWDRQPGVCTVEGCDRRAYGHGLCGKHYQRWATHGDPNSARPKDGPQSFFWVQDDRLSYDTAHNHVQALRGRAAERRCEGCAGPATDWAYDHNDPAEKHSPSGPFSADVQHYLALCKRCHKRFDMAVRLRDGCITRDVVAQILQVSARTVARLIKERWIAPLPGSVRPQLFDENAIYEFKYEQLAPSEKAAIRRASDRYWAELATAS